MPLGVREPDDFGSAFTRMTQTPPDAILMVTDMLTILNRQRVLQFAAERHIPTIFEYGQLARDGGFMSYGAAQADMFDMAAGQIDHILKGAKPGDLPFEQPTRLELIINLKTAKAIGLTVPPSLLARADEVIE